MKKMYVVHQSVSQVEKLAIMKMAKEDGHKSSICRLPFLGFSVLIEADENWAETINSIRTCMIEWF